MPQSGNINILEDELDKLFPLDEIRDLRDLSNDINIDDKKEYIEYIKRLCDAEDDYDIKDKYTLEFVMNLINAGCLSKENVAISAELAEFYFWFCEFCGEKYIYGWTDTGMLDWLYSYVPNHISDETLIYVMTLMSTPLDKDTIDSHLQHNRELWLRYLKDGGTNYSNIFEDGYIDGQKYLDEMYFGVDGGPISASYNSCEIIALYNALYSVNGGVTSPKYDFPELIAQIEGRGPCLNGQFGTSPIIIEEYLEDEGYDIKTLEGNDARDADKLNELQDDYDTYMVTLYNDGNDVSACVHTMCITTVKNDAGETKYMIWNDGDDCTIPKDSIYACLETYSDGDSKNICIIGVNN